MRKPKKKGRKGLRGANTFVPPWKKTKQQPTEDTLNEVQASPPDTKAETPQPTPEEPVEEKPSERLASLTWAKETVRLFRGDQRSLLKILEVYVLYNYSRISPEAIAFFQNEISWRSREAQPIRPFCHTQKPEPRNRSA